MAYANSGRPNNRQYDNTDSGALFKNDQKRGPQDSDYKGSLNVGGRDYWVNAWINDKRDGSGKYMKIKIKPKQEARRDSYERAQEPQRAPLDDDIPF